MKKILTALLLTVAGFANATNYTVTVTTQKQVQYRDKKTGEVVSTSTEVGNAMTFHVVADNPEEARQIAKNRCSSACSSDIYQLEQKNVLIGNVSCDKYVLVVPYDATVQINNNQR